MKRFFTKASSLKPFTPSRTQSTSPTPMPSPLSNQVHTPALQPKFTLPPVPHPRPHEYIALLITSEGILLRPHISHTSSYVRIAWSKEVKVEEIQGDGGEGVDWEECVVIYGIVGILQLFSASYLLVITSRSAVGQLFQPTHAVYGVKGVTAIPLIEDRARIIVNTLASRNAALSRPSLLPHNTLDGLSSAGTETSISSSKSAFTVTDSEITPSTSSPRVQFATEDQVNLDTSQRSTFNISPEDLTPSPASSRASTPSPGNSPGAYPVAKTLADRLSFWTRISKRTTTSVQVAEAASIHNIDGETSAAPTIDSMIQDENAEPAEVISSIIEATAPPPASSVERRTELEEKVVRECIREFTKGGMYFAYNFDITRSLQQKQDQVAKCRREHELLADLNALAEEPEPKSLKKKGHSRKSRSVSVTPGPAQSTPSGTTTTTHKKTNSVGMITPAAGKSSVGDRISLAKKLSKLNANGSVVDVLGEPYPTLPLWRRVDRQFWWNEWLSRPFVDAGLHSYVLPIMQGHYQISQFPIAVPAPSAVLNPNFLAQEDVSDESTMVDYIVVSRRSRDRAGLRYQRRGIDDEAHVANWVETESIMRVEREGAWNVFSYVQVRGSIPLFWTQTGYGLKPPPQLSPERTHDQNLDALRRHFQRTVPRFGPHTVVNLAEQQGKESSITHGYRDYMAELDWKDAQYHEYDFHTETKGMKYENISKLIDNMERVFEHQGYLWICDNMILSRQKGVFRVNCIDCLDRTNVVQSAFARHVMNSQLSAVALLTPSMEGRTETDVVFNDVWANNGDAISRAYAGTSALKVGLLLPRYTLPPRYMSATDISISRGTLPGKRDLGGLLNDGVNSLARMFTSTFSDWFCQAVIDFMLGNRTLVVFSEFLLKLQSTDPRDLIRLSKIRAEAIATCVSRVLSEGERLLSGWTLFAPEELNVRICDKFEEKVLLLTAEAFYIISYDYTLEKVKMYTRIPLGDIVGISKGAYILSPLEEASRNPEQNAGFVITWVNTNQVTRMTSYSVRNSMDMPSSPPSSPTKPTTSFAPSTFPRNMNRLQMPLPVFGRKGSGPVLSKILSDASMATASEKTFAAFKVLPIDPARIRRGTSMGGSTFITEQADELSGVASCKEAVDLMVESIRRACVDVGGARGDFVTESDVVSVAEAQRMTSVYAKMEYGVKRLLWLGG